MGITVEKTLWNVYLPEEHSLFRASGNMTPVLDEVNRTEKMQGTLEELKSLASIIRSDKVSGKTQAAAFNNYGKLSKALENDAKDALDSAKELPDTSLSLNVKKQDAARQQLEVSRQAGSIQTELAKETQDVQKFKEIRKKEFQATQSTEQITIGQNEGKSWASNKSYSTPAVAAGEKPMTQQIVIASGNNLIINDNVILQNGSNSAGTKGGSGSPTLQGSNTYTGAQQIDGTLDAGGNISFNTARANAYAGQTQITNSTLKREQDELKPAQESISIPNDGSLSALPVGKMGLAQAHASFGISSSTVKAMAPAAAAPAAPQSTPAAVSDYRTLDMPHPITTGNRSGRGSGGGISANAIDALLFSPTPGEPSAQASAPVSAAVNPAGDMIGTRTMGGDREDADSPAQPQSKPTGRVSLRVDFPTEGQLLHFKKLKENAVLDLWINRPSAFVRWKWAFGFLVIGGALALASAWVEKRRTTRKS